MCVGWDTAAECDEVTSMIEYGCIVGGVLGKEMIETLLVEGMEMVLVVEGILLAVG